MTDRVSQFPWGDRREPHAAATGCGGLAALGTANDNRPVFSLRAWDRLSTSDRGSLVAAIKGRLADLASCRATD